MPLHTQRECGPIFCCENSKVESGVFFTGGADGIIKIWSLKDMDKENTQNLSLMSGYKHDLKMSDTINTKEAKLKSPSKISKEFSFRSNSEVVWELASHFNKKLILSSSPNEVKLWRYQTNSSTAYQNELVKSFTRKVVLNNESFGWDIPTSVAWVSDNTFISGYSYSNEITLFDIESYKILSNFSFSKNKPNFPVHISYDTTCQPNRVIHLPD